MNQDTSDELFEAVKKVQREFPELFPALPYKAIFAEDVYDVLYYMAKAAQNHESEYAGFDFSCEGCCTILDEEYSDVYCSNCYDALINEIGELQLRMDELQR